MLMKKYAACFFFLPLLLVGAGCTFSAPAKLTATAPLPTPVIDAPAASQPVPAPQAPTPTAQTAQPFRDCNNPASKKTWLPSFQTVIAVSGENDATIGDSCLSLDGKTALVLIVGDYCEGPTVYRYDIETKIAKKAQLNDHKRGCLASPTTFGTDWKDNTLHLVTSGGGDGGCQSTMYFDYTLATNTVELKKEHSTCDEDKTDGTWTNY